MAWIYFFFHLLAFIKEIHTLFTKFKNSKIRWDILILARPLFAFFTLTSEQTGSRGSCVSRMGNYFPYRKCFPNRKCFPYGRNHFLCGKYFPDGQCGSDWSVGYTKSWSGMNFPWTSIFVQLWVRFQSKAGGNIFDEKIKLGPDPNFWNP